MLLGIAYFPPVSYFALIAKVSTVYIEACENYQKQSWRNRCRIYAADGPQYLNFPVVHEGGTHELPISEIKVDYSTPWVVRTERAITSAYESSAFFDYYKDELFAILDSKPVTLFDLDLRIIRFFLRKTGISADIRLTEEYVPPCFYGREGIPVRTDAGQVSSGCYDEDYREKLHPKRPDTVLRDLGLEKPYFQVFARKYGFISDLSIMDLLFNEGPDSILYLKG
ncbi:MAG: WbqC family protein [Bacteroidales bacterium]|nr:WbqC family protein [Bacteroidales bacterium]